MGSVRGVDRAQRRQTQNIAAGYSQRSSQPSPGVRKELTTQEDSERIVKLFKAEFPPIAEIKHIYELVCNYLQIAIGDGGEGSFPFNIYDFCHTVRLSSSNVVNALKILEQNKLMTLIDDLLCR